MTTDQYRQPAGIHIGGQFAGHLHAESDIPDLGTGPARPARGAIFSEEDLRTRTAIGRSLAAKQRDLGELQKNPIRNVLKIKAAQRHVDDLVRGYNSLVEIPAADNEKWHQEHPDAPSWAHKETDEMYSFYKKFRNFQVTAEATDYSPEADAARRWLHHSQLDESDRERLVRYFHYHERHGCKDRSDLSSPYWTAQRELHAAASQPLPMSETVTVWRGENYSSASQSDPAERALTAKRVSYLLSLEPGDPFTWDSCAATSLSLHTAASGNFSGSMRPESFRHPESGGNRRSVSHSVLFELETDRGIYIDKELATAAPANEDEILLPRNMPFEVVGHSQMSALGITTKSPGPVFHVIKLKLGPSV